MLPSFISDVKDKHPTFILASYGAECYCHSFPTFFLRATKYPVRAKKKLIINDLSGPIGPPRKKVSVESCYSIANLCPVMFHFNALNFNVYRSEEVISFF